MPIYEYINISQEKGCDKCLLGFEVIQPAHAKELTICPDCGQRVKKTISKCRAIVVENDATYVRTEKMVKDYEKRGMWSHAAELADKGGEKFKDRTLQNRARENYRRAGYGASAIKKTGYALYSTGHMM